MSQKSFELRVNEKGFTFKIMVRLRLRLLRLGLAYVWIYNSPFLQLNDY